MDYAVTCKRKECSVSGVIYMHVYYVFIFKVCLLFNGDDKTGEMQLLLCKNYNEQRIDVY